MTEIFTNSTPYTIGSHMVQHKENKTLMLPKIGTHYHFDHPIDILEQPITYMQTIQAQVIDMTDKLMMEAIIQAARENKIDDLYILDKTFILEAIAEKIERMKGENYGKDC